MKSHAHTSPCVLPICTALSLLNVSPAQAECVPAGTPQDDTIVCTDVDTGSVDGGGGNDSVTVDAGASLVVREADGDVSATGIVLGLGTSTVDNFGKIDAAARAKRNSVAYAVGGLGGVVDASARSAATAQSIARGLFTGDGNYLISNYREFTATSGSSASAIASSLAALGSAHANASATGLAESAGISVGSGNNWLINFESGSIAAIARAAVEGEGARATATAAGSGLSIVDSLATADATGVQAGDGNNVIDNRGAVTAFATTNAEGYASTSVKGTLTPTAQATIDKTSRASAAGMTAGHGDNVIQNSGTLTVDAQAYAQFYTYAAADAVSESQAWVPLTGIPLPAKAYADTTAMTTASAFGIDVGNGANTIRNSGSISATATSIAEASAVALVLTIPISWEEAASATATANAIGINAGSGDNDITNTLAGQISVGVDLSADARVLDVAYTSTEIAELSFNAWGVSTGSGNNTIRNYGRIDVTAKPGDGDLAVYQVGGIRTGEGNDVVVNQGLVSSGFIWGAANDWFPGLTISTGGGSDAVILASGSSTIGYVVLGSGDDTLQVQAGGALEGRALADQGFDTFVLGGDTSGTLDLARIGPAADFQDFEAFRKQGLSTWTLIGDKTIDWTVDAGTLAIAGQLTGTVQTDAASSGAVIDVLASGHVRSGLVGPVVLDGPGALMNRGLIEGTSVSGSSIGVLVLGNGNRIINSGQISVRSPDTNESVGILLSGSEAQVVNAGVVRSEGMMGSAVVLASDGGVVFNYGVLAAAGPAMSFESAAGTYNTLINRVGGSVESTGTLAIAGGAGNDALANDGDIRGAVDLGDGNNDLANRGSMFDGVTTGAGDDDLANDGDIHGAVNLGDGNNEVANHGSMLSGVTTGAGDDYLANFGEIRGAAGVALGLGDGADRLMIAPSSRIDGISDGGAGTDTFVLGGSVDGRFDLDEVDSAYVGFEQFRKEDTSRWVLVGSANGPWTLADSALIVNGTLLGDVLVESPGRLGGIGAVGTLVNHGTVAPGNSIGALGVAGDYVHGPAAALEIEIDGAGRGDRVDVGGIATLQGGTVQVVPDGSFGIATEYSILEADVGIDGRFASLYSTRDFLDPELDYEPNRIMLTVIRNDFSFASFGETFNQLAVGTALDANKKAAARGDFKPAMDEFLSLSADEIPAALDAVDDELHATTQTSLLRVGDAFLATAVDRQLSASRKEDGHRVVWADGFGAYGSPDADGNASGADYRTTGIATGIDVNTGANTRLGFAFGFSNGSTDLDRPGAGTADANSLHFAVYGAYEEGPWSLRSALAYSGHDVDAERAIRYGTTDRVAKSSYDADQYSAYVRGSGSVGMTTDDSLQPFVTVAWSQLDPEHFNESGADSLNLTVDGGQTDSLLSVLGLRAVWDRQWQRGHVRPELSVGWVHQYLDDHGEVTASLQGAAPSDGYQSFTIRGVTTPRDGLLAGAGLVADLGQNSRVFLNYDLSHDSDGTDQAVVAGVRVAW